MRTHCHNIGCSHLDIGALPLQARHIETCANQHCSKCGSAKPAEMRRSLATEKRGDVIFWTVVVQVARR